MVAQNIAHSGKRIGLFGENNPISDGPLDLFKCLKHIK